MNYVDEEGKAQQVQAALKGLDVKYGRHSFSKGLTPNMAKVNGYSIIWHEYAYCAGIPDMVEVMSPDGEVDGHVLISSLRKMVT